MMLFILSFLTGLLIKVVDIIEDENLKIFSKLKYLFSIIYGFLLGYVIVSYPDIAPLWIGMILGVLLTGKVDTLTHKLGVLTVAITLLVFSLFDFNILKINFGLLFLFSLASFTDEKVDVLLQKVKSKNIFHKLMDLRLFLEASALVTSIITGIWSIFFAILMFDLAYKLTELFFEKFVLKK